MSGQNPSEVILVRCQQLYRLSLSLDVSSVESLKASEISYFFIIGEVIATEQDTLSLCLIQHTDTTSRMSLHTI